jgi:hypothetical protein
MLPFSAGFVGNADGCDVRACFCLAKEVLEFKTGREERTLCSYLVLLVPCACLLLRVDCFEAVCREDL